MSGAHTGIQSTAHLSLHNLYADSRRDYYLQKANPHLVAHEDFIKRAQRLAKEARIPWETTRDRLAQSKALKTLQFDGLHGKSVARFLNVVSSAVHAERLSSEEAEAAQELQEPKSWFDTTRFITWTGDHEHLKLKGDFMDTQIRPDICSVVIASSNIPAASSVNSSLSSASSTANIAISTRLSWSNIASTGESESADARQHGVAQMLDYAGMLAGYRPELRESHGIVVHKDLSISVSTTNACGVWRSEKSAPLNSFDVWISHVILVYHANSTSSQLVSQLPRQTPLFKWTGGEWPMRPFLSRQRPYRGTFAAFADDCLLKMSWQPVAGDEDESLTTEGRLYEKLHAGEWLPGAARHVKTWREGPAISGADDKRALEVVILGSIGRSLADCDTVKELLCVWYDALESKFAPFGWSGSHVCQLWKASTAAVYYTATYRPTTSCAGRDTARTAWTNL